MSCPKIRGSDSTSTMLTTLLSPAPPSRRQHAARKQDRSSAAIASDAPAEASCARAPDEAIIQEHVEPGRVAGETQAADLGSDRRHARMGGHAPLGLPGVGFGSTRSRIESIIRSGLRCGVAAWRRGHSRQGASDPNPSRLVVMQRVLAMTLTTNLQECCDTMV